MIAAALSPAAADGAADHDLSALMARLATVRAATASFVEVRHQRLLTIPQQSSGRLVYVAPDKLQKDIVQPTPERMIVDGGTLVIERQGDPPRRLVLDDYPPILGVIESIRGTLSGDLARLQRHYRVGFTPAGDGWTLLLEPVDPKLAEFVTAIRISGREAKIARIETDEAGGDRTVTSITLDGP